MRCERGSHAACHLLLREKDRKLQEWQFKFETLKSLHDEVLKTLLTEMNRSESQKTRPGASGHSAVATYLSEELRKIAVAPADIDRIRLGVLLRLEERGACGEAEEGASRRVGAVRDVEPRKAGGRPRQEAQAPGPKQRRRVQASQETEASELLRRDALLHRSESSLLGAGSLPAEYQSAAESVSLHLPAYSKLLRLDRALFRPAKKGPVLGTGLCGPERPGASSPGRSQK